jgi:hypothetical protein
LGIRRIPGNANMGLPLGGEQREPGQHDGDPADVVHDDFLWIERAAGQRAGRMFCPILIASLGNDRRASASLPGTRWQAQCGCFHSWLRRGVFQRVTAKRNAPPGLSWRYLREPWHGSPGSTGSWRSSRLGWGQGHCTGSQGRREVQPTRADGKFILWAKTVGRSMDTLFTKVPFVEL